MVDLAREFDACGECRLEIGGPKKYRTLSDDEILRVVEALEQMPKLTFDDALQIARGCTDYGGGYRFEPEKMRIYQHGIQTVINALTGAAENGLEDMQVAALHVMGANAEITGG